MAGTVVIASAGSGKTTHLVERAGALSHGRILITTYTNENLENIRQCLLVKHGFIPSHIELATWYSVLLKHGIRPYQNLVSGVGVSQAIYFENLPDAARFVKKSDVDRYFFTSRGDVYRDRASDFVCFVNEKTQGLVIQRLEGIFTHILIDELQDLCGYDLELLEKLLRSNIEVIAVGDPRQGTYTTNNAAKNKAAAKAGIADWLSEKAGAGLVKIEERSESWRSNQVICDFADALYPNLPRTTSLNTLQTEHDGIFQIPAGEALAYAEKYQPVVLRWDKRAKTLGLPARNIGISKGQSFDRVLIFPTGPMKKYLASRDLSEAGDLAKFYVAVTRARYSVTFVV